MAIIEETIGWQRDRAEISLTTLCKYTRLTRQGVVNAIEALQRQNVIRIVARGTTTKTANVYQLLPFANWSTKETSQQKRLVNATENNEKVDQSPQKSRLVNAEKLTSTSQMSTPEGTHIKKKEISLRNSLKKEKGGMGENEKELDVNAKGLRPLATPTLTGHVIADTAVGEGVCHESEGNDRDVPPTFDLYNTGTPVHHVSPAQSAAWIAEVVQAIPDKTPLKGIIRGNVAVIETIVDHTLTLTIRNGIFVEKLNEPAFKDPLTDAFEEVLGERHRLNIVAAKGGAQR